MTVTYGRKCSGLSEKLSRLGYLVRTYLESCPLPGKQFVRTWSVRDTLSPYLILKLRLSERRTDVTGCSLWRMWPTPTARDYKDGTAKSCKNVPVNGLLGRAVHMWPTPQSSDYRDRGNLSNPCIQKRIQSGKQVNLSMCVSEVSGQLNPDWVST